MRTFSHLLFLVFTLAACAKGTGTPADATATGTFLVDPVTAKVSDLTTDPVFTGLSSARLYQFTACFKDVGMIQPIVGASFQISDETNKVLDTKTTDSTGCITWAERISFAQAQTETFLQTTRTFTALTIHKGKVEVQLALDPWKKDSDALRDLRTQPAPAVMRKMGTEDKSAGGALVVETVALQLHVEQAANHLASTSLRLIFTPKLRHLSLDGRPQIDNLSEGRLHVRAQLFADAPGGATPVTDLFEITAVPVEQGVAHAEKKVQLLTAQLPNSALLLRFEAHAEGTLGGVQPAEGVVSLGALSGVSTSFSGPLVPNTSVNFRADAVTPKASPLASDGQEEPLQEVVLSQASYKFEGRKFQIDSSLNLSTTRRYRFALQPVLRAGDLPSQRLGDGHYVVKFLLETGGDLGNSTVVDAQTVSADAMAGSLNVDVDFTLRDLRMLMSRMNLTIQIIPDDGLTTKPYSDAIDLLGSGSLTLLPRTVALDDRMALATAASKPASPGADLFAHAYGLTTLDAAFLKANGAAEADPETLLTGKPADLAKFCGLFFTPARFSWFSNYDKCVAHPEKLLVTAATAHVHKLYSSKLSHAPESSQLSLSAGLSASIGKSQSHSFSHSNSVGADVNVGLSVPLLNLVGVNLGAGVRYGQNWGTADVTSNDNSSNSHRGADLSKSLSVDRADFDLDADVDRCAILSVLNAEPTDPKRYFYCSPQTDRRVARESYYFIVENGGNNALQDRGAADQPFLALLRGTDRFTAFATAAANSNLNLGIFAEPPIPAEILNASNGQFDGLFPGLLSGK